MNIPVRRAKRKSIQSKTGCLQIALVLFIFTLHTFHDQSSSPVCSHCGGCDDCRLVFVAVAARRGCCCGDWSSASRPLRSHSRGGVAQYMHPDERFGKCAVSVKTLVSCKRKAEPTKWFCIFRKACLGVNRA